MLKPNDFESVQEYGDFIPVELGGHVCKIMGVKETKSKKDKDMLEISLDIAEGNQIGYYAAQYKADSRTPKKWGCIVYQLIYDNDGNTNRGLKTFITAVEKSNPNFKVTWDDNFANGFKNKLVGGVFGREQYQDTKGELKFSTKCSSFKSVDIIKAGVEVPEDKLLAGYVPTGIPNAANSTASTIGNLSEFEEILGDGELPF